MLGPESFSGLIIIDARFTSSDGECSQPILEELFDAWKFMIHLPGYLFDNNVVDLVIGLNNYSKTAIVIKLSLWIKSNVL